ncbi:accessory gene regulator ArgB-like protein [Candidatus Frackibacter sp. WG13]|uniref:accessory gene regulator ArgB-like protein n=1 Tax=Candidatus Frackibacter sp. WG13 TaxID=2017978 RepID=UPI0008E79228|nr:accessory gene regulator B family protein [Candidatus Frackibacter sp. WG13]SFL92090.1 accessory gene regulator B [Candidatus Frackibacter sp. WG13]
MQGIKSVSDKIIEYLFESHSQEEKETFKYGLTILLSTLGGYLLIMIFYSLFNVTWLALTAAVSASLIRIFSGGVHASCFRNCALTWTAVFTMLALIAHNFANQIEYMYILIWTILLIGCVIIYFYSPADIEEKPITSIEKRFKLKKLSFIIFFILILFYYILNLIGSRKQFILAGSLGMLWQLFTITPLAYKLFNRKY